MSGLVDAQGNPLGGLDEAIKEQNPPTVLEHSPRRAAGYITISGPTGITEAETLQCCHCGGHWIVQRGSGIRRGFCLLCVAVTCGSTKCDTCTPMEKELEVIEAKWWDEYHAHGGQMGR